MAASQEDSDLRGALPLSRANRLRVPRFVARNEMAPRWRNGRRGGPPVRFYASASFGWMMAPREMRYFRVRERGISLVQFNGGGRWGWRGGGRVMRRGLEAPDAAARELQRQGYSNIEPLTRRGGNYVGEATGPRGGRQRVIIDAGSGRVTGSSPSGPQRPIPPPGAGWYGGY